MLVDMSWIMSSRYPVSHCFQPAAGEAKRHGIGHAFACQKVYIIFICQLLLFLSCPWGISMKWIYGVKLDYDWFGLLLVEMETKGYRIAYMRP